MKVASINKNNMKLTFLGATRTVTGSKYLVEYKDKKVLIDCFRKINATR